VRDRNFPMPHPAAQRPARARGAAGGRQRAAGERGTHCSARDIEGDPSALCGVLIVFAARTSDAPRMRGVSIVLAAPWPVRGSTVLVAPRRWLKWTEGDAADDVHGLSLETESDGASCIVSSPTPAVIAAPSGIDGGTASRVPASSHGGCAFKSAAASSPEVCNSVIFICISLCDRRTWYRSI